MGSLDSPEGSKTKREIKIVDLTGLTINQIENNYNNNYGLLGWRIVQIIELGGTRYLLAEREIV